MPSHEEQLKEEKHVRQVEAKIAEPTCCVCVPYRTGVFITASLTVYCPGDEKLDRPIGLVSDFKGP